ncbi:MAG: F0F1 ATP synthase subunit A [Melioribacteraceae bacterium]
MTENNEQIQINEAVETAEHGHTIYAEPILHIGSFTVTNSLLNSWLAVILIVLFAFIVKKRIKTIPGKLQVFVEIVVEGFLDFFDSITASRKKSEKFFPFIFTFFIYILLSNWIGILPGIGSIGKMVAENGHEVFVPYFRGGTADLNTTLALAIIGVVASHIVGVIFIGWWNHLNKFINLKTFAEIPKKFKKDKMVLLVNPIQALASLLEIITEFAKVASLSFRLFGNIFAGEVLLASMSAMLAFGLPIPFMFLEVLVGFVQALVFSLLVLSYLSMSTEKH